jgi:hypothetical protein
VQQQHVVYLLRHAQFHFTHVTSSSAIIFCLEQCLYSFSYRRICRHFHCVMQEQQYRNTDSTPDYSTGVHYYTDILRDLNIHFNIRISYSSTNPTQRVTSGTTKSLCRYSINFCMPWYSLKQVWRMMHYPNLTMQRDPAVTRLDHYKNTAQLNYEAV